MTAIYPIPGRLRKRNSETFWHFLLDGCKTAGKARSVVLLYHAGFKIIKEPDIHYGRKNADFGQGFYATEEEEFAYRWARERKGEQTIVNTYELDTTGLAVHRFNRDSEWFGYIYGNRNRKEDGLAADVIIGPIANDTIYNTFGVITSGFLKPEDAMKLLLIGPEYYQVAIKTEKAAAQLRWLSSKELSRNEIAKYRETVNAEEKEYQELFARELEKITGD